MTEQMPILANKSTPIKNSLYTEFILWSAMPEGEQIRLGLETQKAFAEFHNVEESTLSRWKNRADYEKRVDAILKMWSVGKTPTVIHGIYRAAVKGNPMSQLLWLQYFKNFSQKSEIEHSQKVEIGENDIRFIIAVLPEPYRSKFYGYIDEIIATTHEIRNAGEIDETNWSERPAGDLPQETDHDAQTLPDTGANEVPESDSASVRSDMGNNTGRRAFASASDYQSASRRWQE